MVNDSTAPRECKWCDSAHASLGLLGAHLRRVGGFRPMEERVRASGVSAQRRFRLDNLALDFGTFASLNPV
jgi:hypothetical protein